MKLKNSKYKNTGLIFELLSRQLVTDVVENKTAHSANFIKKYFNKNTLLHKELSLYKALAETTNLAHNAVGKLIDIVLAERATINNRKLSHEKYNLIKEIKENYDDSFFSNRISSYKKLGNIYKLFENNSSKAPVLYAECHATLVEQIKNTTSGDEKSDQLWESQDPAVKKIALKLLIEKFNNKYKNLNTKQKTLLSKYINENTQSTSFKEYIYSEVANIKNNIDKIDTSKNKSLEIKLNEISSMTKLILTSNIIKENHVSSMLKYYELLDVLKSNK